MPSSTEAGILVAVEESVPERGDRVELAELVVEKLTPPVLEPGSASAAAKDGNPQPD
jgi:hypothetical protein